MRMRKYIKPKNKPKFVIFKPREITNDKSLSEFISNGIDIVKYKICENNKDIKLILSMESSKLMALIGGLVLKNDGFISYKDVIKKIKSLSNELIEYPDNLMSACKIIELEHKGIDNITIDIINSTFNEDFSDYVKYNTFETLILRIGIK